MSKFHSYHLVDISPWPFYSSFFFLSFFFSNVFFFSGYCFCMVFCFFLFSFFLFYFWWRDASRESGHGFHGLSVYLGIGFGMILFIASEVFFFFSFFWSFFHFGLSPSVELGQVWPPVGVWSFDPLGVPFLNTLILLSSGVSVTFSHHFFLNGNFYGGLLGLTVTISLGLYFTLIQAFEYYESYFCFSDSCYGSVFFIGTGFHGLHVIVGSLFLLVCLVRFFSFSFGFLQMTGFDLSVWYWHFVDVVWLFLYVSFYWWGHSCFSRC